MTTEPLRSPQGATASAGAEPAKPSRQLWRAWSVGSLLVLFVAGAMFWFVFGPEDHASSSPKTAAIVDWQDVIQVAGPSLLRVKSDTLFEKKIQVSAVKKITTDSPRLRVTGTVAASLRPGNGKSDYWQFHSAEVLTAYTEWQKALADISFSEAQRKKIQDLAVAREAAQTKVVGRLVKTVAAGTEAERDLDEAKLKLLELQIQGSKEVYEAQNQVKLATRSEAALRRQLQLAGLEPEVIQAMTKDADIVMAEVPEGKISLVKVGQACTAQFFGIPGQIFTGKVTSVSPALSKERRTLRVLFTVHDPHDHVKAGMFADIGLDTETRSVLTVPAEAVLHAGSNDYVMKEEGRGNFRAVKVVVDEPRQDSLRGGDSIPILEGLREGDRVVGRGCILLKPMMVKALASDVSDE